MATPLVQPLCVCHRQRAQRPDPYPTCLKGERAWGLRSRRQVRRSRFWRSSHRSTRCETCPERRFYNLFKGTRLENFERVLPFVTAIAPSVLHCDVDAKAVAEADNVPWPITYLADTFHRKHVFINNNGINTKALAADLAKVVNKLYLRYFCEHQEASVGGQLPFHVPLKVSPAFSKTVPPELRVARYQVLSHILRAASTANVQRRGDEFSNIGEVHRWGLRFLREGDLALVATDRGNGFAVEGKAALPVAMRRHLANEHCANGVFWYRCYPLQSCRNASALCSQPSFGRSSASKASKSSPWRCSNLGCVPDTR